MEAPGADLPVIHTRRLRHAFALTSLTNGGNTLGFQRIVGHPAQGYVALVTDDLQREHDRCSPLVALAGSSAGRSLPDEGGGALNTNGDPRALG